jgi:BASS family bile acid:Na+ symporter
VIEFEFLLRLGVVVFMVGSLGGVGLGLTVRELVTPLTDIRFVAGTLIVGWLVCPAIALLLLQLIPLAPHYATGLLLIALAPCAPFTPVLVQKVGGESSYTAGLMMLSAVGTVALMPVMVPVLTPGLSADPFVIARPLLRFVLLPLLVGMAANWLDPDRAARTRPWIAKITSTAGLLVLALIIAMYGRGVLGAIGSFAIATQAIFVILVTIAAHAAGWSLKPEHRSVLTLGMCTRNLGAALAPLAGGNPDPQATVMIAIGAPVTLVASALVARLLASRREPIIAALPDSHSHRRRRASL